MRSTLCSPRRTLLLAMPASAQQAPYRDARLPIERRVNDLLVAHDARGESRPDALPLGSEKAHHGRERTLRRQRPRQGGSASGSAASSGRRTDTTRAARRSSSTRFSIGCATARGSEFPCCSTKRRCTVSRRPARRAFRRRSRSRARGTRISCNASSPPLAAEARARGVRQVLAPVVDVAREPRWGRFEETYGEDPYLVARMGVAAVRGFQGTRFRDRPAARDRDAQAHDRPRPARVGHEHRAGVDRRAHAARCLPLSRSRSAMKEAARAA